MFLNSATLRMKSYIHSYDLAERPLLSYTYTLRSEQNEVTNGNVVAGAIHTPLKTTLI
jgi:hypothetical protein